MTSKPIKLFLSLTPKGEKAEIIRCEAEMLERDGKLLVRTEDMRVQIDTDRVLIRRDYQLDIDPTRNTPLDYPTPYGVLSMEVQTESLTVSADRRRVEGDYTLLTNHQPIHTIHLTLTISED